MEIILTQFDPDRPAPARRGLSRGRQTAILGIVAAALLGLFFVVPVLGRMFAPRPPPPAAAPPPGTFQATPEQWATLDTAVVQSMDFRPLADTDGKIAVDDDRTTAVYSPYTGRVTRVFARLGDRVAAGAPLFAIDASEFVQGQSDLLNAAAQVKLTEAAQARQQALYKDNGAALKDLEQSQADYAAARAALAAARDRLRVLGESPAAISALERDLSDHGMAPETIVRAPIAGVITQKSVGVGQNLASVVNNGAATPAYSVSDLSTVWLAGNLREADAPRARVGQSVEVRVDALPGKVFSARVDYVSPMVDPVTRRVTVRAEIPNPGGELLPEMFATFELVTGAASSAIGVPEQAVIYEADTARVWVAKGDRVLELRTIRTGQTTGGMVEVLSGLAAGERVVTSGSLFIDRAAKGD